MARRRKHDVDQNLVVGYVRVSTEEQKLGPQAQIDQIREWCEREGKTLCAVCEDIGVSGASPLEKRPGLLQAVVELRDRQAGAILVVRHDRIARDIGLAVAIEKLIEDVGAVLLSCDGVGNEATAEGEMVRNLMRVLAQYERQLIRMRTRAALAVKKRRGLRHNKNPPYGYAWDKENRLVADAREQRALAAIRDMRGGGTCLREITESLERQRKRCPPRGKCWHMTTVARIVRRLEEAGELKRA